MQLSVFDIWREGKGIGRLSFNFRMIAYVTAACIVVVYHRQNDLPLGFFGYLTLSQVLVIPAWMLYLFVKSGKNTKYIVDALAVDFFCVGWVIGVLDLCAVPSIAFSIGAITNHVAAKGFTKIYRAILIPLGVLVSLTVNGFDTHFESTTLINYLTIGYGVIHYIANSYVLAVSIERVKMQNQEIKKQRIEIEEKSEELKVLNESLKDMNATLELKVAARTEELQIKNQKLQEYTFVNSHKLRAPVARILGLINLLDYKNIYDSELIVTQLRNSATELDEMTRDIGAKLEADQRENASANPDAKIKNHN